MTIKNIIRWIFVATIPFLAFVAFFFVDYVLLLAIPANPIIDSIVSGLTLGLFSSLPAGGIAPRWKLLSAAAVSACEIIYWLWGKPPFPTWSYWIILSSLIIGCAIGITLVYSRFGTKDTDIGWPWSITITRYIVRAFAFCTTGIVASILSLGIYNIQGTAQEGYFHKGFPFRITHGYVGSTGYNIDHIGFLLNCLVYGITCYLVVTLLKRIMKKVHNKRLQAIGAKARLQPEP